MGLKFKGFIKKQNSTWTVSPIGLIQVFTV